MKNLLRCVALAFLVTATLLGAAHQAQAAPKDDTFGPKAAAAQESTQGAGQKQAAATDASPCGGRWYHSGINTYVQTCPDWAPADSPFGAHKYPVFSLGSEPKQVGTIYAPGNDWFICQKQVTEFDPFPAHGYWNNWWAYTMADNGKMGWVPEVYFKGGGNNQADANLAKC